MLGDMAVPLGLAPVARAATHTHAHRMDQSSNQNRASSSSPSDSSIRQGNFPSITALESSGELAAATRDAVTEQVARDLAELTFGLETRGRALETVTSVLLQCACTLFADHLGVSPTSLFRGPSGTVTPRVSDDFEQARQALSRGAPAAGGFDQFLPAVKDTLELDQSDLTLLHRIAHAEWENVEPSILGMLHTRALNRAERHRRGAEYTPRTYVERLIRPAVVEPIRARWMEVQREVEQLHSRPDGSGPRPDPARARAVLQDFHEWLGRLRFLDPACGSGDILYVTLQSVMGIEDEVLHAIRMLADPADRLEPCVGPGQFHGIEINPHAAALAEVTLRVAYFQHRRLASQDGTLSDSPCAGGTAIECRDAVLAWEDEDPPQPNGGKAVGYRGAQQAAWPEADFIVGNPPFVGNKRMREALGSPYVEALRSVYPKALGGSDLVMFWWWRMAEEVAAGRSVSAGVITTNSIVQRLNRTAVTLAAERGAAVSWAAPDHPWVRGSKSAAVRIAMTVIERDPAQAHRVEVDRDGRVVRIVEARRLNADLTVGADVSSAASIALETNRGITFQGIYIPKEFERTPAQLERLTETIQAPEGILQPYRNGKDITGRCRGISVLLPAPTNRSRDLRGLRKAVSVLGRYIVVPRTARHLIFTFVDGDVLPGTRLAAIASSDPAVLGVLSSSVHRAWAHRADPTGQGVGNDFTYNHSACFNAFPFPDASPDILTEITHLAEQLDSDRKKAIAGDDRVTMTKIYNIIAKLRSKKALTPEENRISSIVDCVALRRLHDDLDRLVGRAYGWDESISQEDILRNLVALHIQQRRDDAKPIKWLRQSRAPVGRGPAEFR
jgi:hypothetical protein